MTRSLGRILVALLLVLLVATPIRTARAAAVWYVDLAGADTNHCQWASAACLTVGAAMRKAGPGDTIVIGIGTFVENLVIDQRLTLRGAGADKTIIDGGYDTNPLQGPVVTVRAGPTAIEGLTITKGANRNGNPTGEGGGIVSNVDLTLTKVIIRENYINGGITNSGTLTMTDVLVSGNESFLQGAGINNSGTLAISSSNIRNNHGRSSPGGGLYNSGSAIVEDSAIRGNKSRGGGGIHNTGTLTVRRSTITENSSVISGGAMANEGTATLINSTISNNKGVVHGIMNWAGHATTTMIASTVHDMIDMHYGTGTVRQTLVRYCSGTLVSEGYNLVAQPLQPASYGCSMTPTTGDLIGSWPDGIDAKLGPLTDNGGPTPTHALLPSSPAIDAVPAAACAVETDQRGLVRPQGAACDIGALEFGIAMDQVLDDFSGPRGPLGPNWSGPEGLGGYNRGDGVLYVPGGGPIYWQPMAFGPSQEAFVTLPNYPVHGSERILLLKVQGDTPDWRSGVIEVLHRHNTDGSQVVRVETYQPALHAWTVYPDIPLTLRADDQFGAQVRTDGTVTIYRNRVAVQAVTLNTTDQAFFNLRGGRIGLWFERTYGWLDDFGGANLPATLPAWYVAPTGDDSNHCQAATRPCRTIGAAISKAGPHNTIMIATGTFTENLTIDRPLTIQGAGMDRTIINGGYPTSNQATMHVSAGPTAISELTITQGGSFINGLFEGGIVNSAELSITSASVSGNSLGGGINNTGTLTITRILVSNNQSNQVGGITNSGKLIAYDSTIRNNRVPLFAGGLGNGGTATLTNTLITDNYSARGTGGIHNSGTLTIHGGLVAFNRGGTYGGNIFQSYFSASLTLVNASIGGGQSSPGLLLGGQTELIASSVGDEINTRRFQGTVRARQTMMYECDGMIISEGYNLLPLQPPGNTRCTFTPTVGDLIGGHPTVDVVPIAACAVTEDSRRVSRPQGPACDIGPTETTVGLATILDDFNRPDGPLGPNWSGHEGLGGYQINGGTIEVSGGGPIYWQPSAFGASQEALVTLTALPLNEGGERSLLLKVQGNTPDWRNGVIEVLYQADRVHIETYRPGQSDWTVYPTIPLTLRADDQLGAQARADGTILIYRNRVPVGSTALNAADQAFFNQRGGRIGVWFLNAQGTMDSFGGGSSAP